MAKNIDILVKVMKRADIRFVEKAHVFGKDIELDKDKERRDVILSLSSKDATKYVLTSLQGTFYLVNYDMKKFNDFSVVWAKVQDLVKTHTFSTVNGLVNHTIGLGGYGFNQYDEIDLYPLGDIGNVFFQEFWGTTYRTQMNLISLLLGDIENGIDVKNPATSNDAKGMRKKLLSYQS